MEVMSVTSLFEWRFVMLNLQHCYFTIFSCITLLFSRFIAFVASNLVSFSVLTTSTLV